MKTVLINSIKLVATLFFVATAIQARPTVQFTSTTISVSQAAGVIEIPYSITGAKDPDDTKDPSFEYSTQAGTASSRNGDYKGVSTQGHAYVNYDGISAVGLLKIPIYYTGDTYDKFFTVILTEGRGGFFGTPNNVFIGSPSAITVTILGVPTYFIRAKASPVSKGHVYGSGVYTFGSRVTLKAVPKKGATFLYWTEGSKRVKRAKLYSFIADRPRNLVARFR